MKLEYKILYFSRSYTTHDHRFLSALAETGHRIHFISLETRGEPGGQLPVPAGIETSPGLSPRERITFADYPALLSELKEIIDQVKPDIIHAGPIQRCAFPVALLDFHPLVSVSWGYDLIHDAGRDTMWRWMTRYTLKQSAVMVGDCDTIRQLAIAHGMPDERIVTFPWGINLGRFTPKHQPGKGANATFSILSTRGWEPIYGIDILARAFVLAAKERPDMRLVMLGGGSMEAQLREIFTGGGVLEKVRFQGLVGTDELPDFFRDTDVYVSASHSDGTSISLLEALASGTPAIVSDIPGNREWIEPGVQGWLFPDGDAEALAQAITNAFDGRQKLSGMGRAARVLAERRANWETNFPHLLSAYDLALGNEVP